MFNLTELETVMGEAIEEKLNTMVKEIRESLSSPTYEKIINDFDIGINEKEFYFNIKLVNGIMAENQDILRVLTYGGIFEKKGKEFIPVPPNMILLRYFK